MLRTLFISVTRLAAWPSEELHCCRLTARCLVLPLCTCRVSVYLKHSRLRFHKDPDSACVFQRGVQKFTRHETAMCSILSSSMMMVKHLCVFLLYNNRMVMVVVAV